MGGGRCGNEESSPIIQSSAVETPMSICRSFKQDHFDNTFIDLCQ